MQAFSGDTHSDLEGFRDLIGSASNGRYGASGPQKNSPELRRRGCHWSQLARWDRVGLDAAPPAARAWCCSRKKRPGASARCDARHPAIHCALQAPRTRTERQVTIMENTTCVSLSTDLAPASSSAEADPRATLLPETERALLGRVACEDPHAFALLYARFAAPVRRYLHRCLGHADLVDDVLQEVMLVLWQRPSACPPTVALTAWLCGIARHKARKAMTRATTPRELPPPPLSSGGDDPARVVLGQESARRLASVLDTLPFYERTALRLLIQQDCSYQDIAAIMETPVSTVRTRVARACHRLRTLIAAGDASPPRPRPSRVSAGSTKHCAL
jgi:RNA polymerase sigma-70 factor, ECF subfamily